VFEGLPWRSHMLLGAGLCVAGTALLSQRGKAVARSLTLGRPEA